MTIRVSKIDIAEHKPFPHTGKFTHSGKKPIHIASQPYVAGIPRPEQPKITGVIHPGHKVVFADHLDARHPHIEATHYSEKGERQYSHRLSEKSALALHAALHGKDVKTATHSHTVTDPEGNVLSKGSETLNLHPKHEKILAKVKGGSDTAADNDNFESLHGHHTYTHHRDAKVLFKNAQGGTADTTLVKGDTIRVEPSMLKTHKQITHFKGGNKHKVFTVKNNIAHSLCKNCKKNTDTATSNSDNSDVANTLQGEHTHTSKHNIHINSSVGGATHSVSHKGDTLHFQHKGKHVHVIHTSKKDGISHDHTLTEKHAHGLRDLITGKHDAHFGPQSKNIKYTDKASVNSDVAHGGGGGGGHGGGGHGSYGGGRGFGNSGSFTHFGGGFPLRSTAWLGDGLGWDTVAEPIVTQVDDGDNLDFYDQPEDKIQHVKVHHSKKNGKTVLHRLTLEQAHDLYRKIKKDKGDKDTAMAHKLDTMDDMFGKHPHKGGAHIKLKSKHPITGDTVSSTVEDGDTLHFHNFGNRSPTRPIGVAHCKKGEDCLHAMHHMSMSNAKKLHAAIIANTKGDGASVIDVADMVGGSKGFGEHHEHKGHKHIHLKSVHHLRHSTYRAHHAGARKIDASNHPHHTESTVKPGEKVHLHPMGMHHHIATHHTHGGHSHKHVLTNKATDALREAMKAHKEHKK